MVFAGQTNEARKLRLKLSQGDTFRGAISNSCSRRRRLEAAAATATASVPPRAVGANTAAADVSCAAASSQEDALAFHQALPRV